MITLGNFLYHTLKTNQSPILEESNKDQKKTYGALSLFRPFCLWVLIGGRTGLLLISSPLRKVSRICSVSEMTSMQSRVALISHNKILIVCTPSPLHFVSLFINSLTHSIYALPCPLFISNHRIPWWPKSSNYAYQLSPKPEVCFTPQLLSGISDSQSHPDSKWLQNLFIQMAFSPL